MLVAYFAGTSFACAECLKANSETSYFEPLLLKQILLTVNLQQRLFTQARLEQDCLCAQLCWTAPAVNAMTGSKTIDQNTSV